MEWMADMACVVMLFRVLVCIEQCCSRLLVILVAWIISELQEHLKSHTAFAQLLVTGSPKDCE